MEISSVRVVRYDFYRRSQYDHVESSLRDLFETRTALPPQTLSFGETELETESVLFTESSDDIRCDCFESVQTFLVSDPCPQYFCHTLTVGTLAEEELDAMDAGDPTGNRTRRDAWASELESVASLIGQSRIQPDGPDPVLILAEPVLDSLPADSWSQSTIENPMLGPTFIRGNGDVLGPYGFHSTEAISAIDSSYLVTHDENAPIEFPLAVLVPPDQPQVDTEGSTDYWEWWISFAYTRIKTITSILLVVHWLEWRRQAIAAIDEELYEYDLNGSDAEVETSELRAEEQELERLRRTWVESHSAIADEFHDLQQLITRYEWATVATRFDRPVGSETHLSYLYSCIDHVNTEFQTLSTTLDRVETKLDRFISVVQDRIQSNATKSNLELQNTVTTLTIVLAIIAIVEFGLNFLPPALLQSTGEFISQSGILLVGLVLLAIGFVLGHTHT